MAARTLNLAHFVKHFRHSSRYSWTSLLQRTFKTTSVANDVMEIKMPSLSPTMMEGRIVQWFKKEGDTVAAGDLICEIQTDKAVVSHEIDEDGILAKILKTAEDQVIPINTVIGLMVEEGDDWQSVEIPASLDAPQQTPTVTPDEPEPQTTPAHGLLSYGPAVRSILDLYGLTSADVPGTGPHGRLLKGDLLNYINQRNLKPKPSPKVELPKKSTPPSVSEPAAVPSAAPPIAPTPAPTPTPPPIVVSTDAPYEDIPLTNMRSVIAKRLTQSKSSTPHTYYTVTSCVDAVLQMRRDLKKDGVKLSVNDFIIKAAALALQRVPHVNSQWTDQGPQRQPTIDISVAVATDAGLITPIVRDAVSLGLQEISSSVKELAARAKDGKLKPEEFMGGTFTISNLGMFGISHFTAIINPPQAAILAVGGSRSVLDPETEAPSSVMQMTLCADGRIVSDDLAEQFMLVLQESLENPLLMLTAATKLSLVETSAKMDTLFARP